MVAKFIAASGGSDSNSGDILSPWATLTKGFAEAGAGGIDRIVLRGGTHALSGTYSPARDGTDVNNRLSLEAHTGESPLLQNGNLAIDKSYWRFAGFEHTGGYLGQDAFEKRPGHLYEDLHLHHYNAGLGVAIGLLNLSGCDDAIVRRCIIHDMTIAGEFQENAVCLLSYDAARILVEDSELYNARFGCYQKMADSNGGDGMTVRRTRFHDFFSLDGATNVPSPGIYKSTSGGLEPHFNTLTEFCLFVNCSGIAYEFFDVATQSTGHIARNNTLILPSNSLSGPTGIFSWWAGGVQAYNNILYSQSGGQSKGQISTQSASPPGGGVINSFSLIDFNCYFAQGGTSRHWNRDSSSGSFAQATTFAAWKSLAGSSATTYPANKDANSIDTDPLFAETTNYSLASNSPCKLAGRVGGVAGGAPVDMGWQASSSPAEKLIVVF